MGRQHENKGCVVMQRQFECLVSHARIHRQMEARVEVAVVVVTGPLPVALAIPVHIMHALVCVRVRVCVCACVCVRGRVEGDETCSSKSGGQPTLS